jgi:hypothetical protein
VSKEIPVGEYTALVDDEDYPLLSRLTWIPTLVSGKVYPTHFLQSTKSRVTGLMMHHLVMDTKQYHAIVHHDKDPFNNQKSNLIHLSFRLVRAASAPKARESSKYKGVSFNKKQQVWRVQCGDKFLGNFKSEVDAAKAYDIEAFNQYGEWAYQNFSESPLPAKQGEKT